MVKSALPLLLLGLLTGCAVNPVTGKNEIAFIGTEQQIEIGRKNYVPAQQMQGGQYKVDPDLTTYVAGVGKRVVAHSGVDLPYEFVVLNNSIPNAWAMPGGKLAINRGLLTELENEAELAAVLGHEVTHAAARHGAKSMERGTILQGVLLGAAIGTRNSEYAGALLAGGQLAAGLVTQKYGRDAERESDYYGTKFMAQAGYDPNAAVTLQEKFVKMSQGRKSGWIDGLFASHPPSAERVENNRARVQELKAQGITGSDLGVERYQRATKRIRDDKPAYAAFDAARSAIESKQYDVALGEIDKALRLQPAEAQFHGLRGDIRRLQGKHADAVSNYDRAIGRDDGFFAYYLGRGVSHAALKQRADAKSDFSSSLKLLPTAVAYNEMGKLAEAEGNQDEAVRYYAAASQAQDATGQAALTSLVRLDLPRQPERYTKAELFNDNAGRLFVRVTNGTPVAMRDVRVRVMLRWAASGEQSLALDVGNVAGGQYVVREVPLRQESLLAGQAQVVSARTN
ncbi:MAG: M48 family metalloprotease [Pseudomonadales bacterium]